MSTSTNSPFKFQQGAHLHRIMMLSLMTILAGCAGLKSVQRETSTPAAFRALPAPELERKIESSPFLKVHMKNGNTYVLHNWEMDTTRYHVLGTGALLNAIRDTLGKGEFRVGIDSVAILETNVLKTSGTATALMVYTGITAAVTILCITNPKSCFGSCPTFYVSEGDSLRLEAEGFSASIAPSLEATDIDALFHASGRGDEFEIEMRNEALETHVVRYANLFAVPRTKGRRVFANLKGEFWQSTALIPPHSATAPEGDCLALLRNADGVERFSLADSSYLGEKEIIELSFGDLPRQSCGLVIGGRQTLLSTYLLYQAYAYMGNQAGHWLAQIERRRLSQNQNSIQRLLGGIEIMIEDSLRNWTAIAQINEHGPLATDMHVVPLGQLPDHSAKIRLRMTKGHWRIDYVALAGLAQPVEAVRLQPHRVLKDGVVDGEALARLRTTEDALVTLPGDTYTIQYRLPANSADFELFLESRGYYLEWMRKEWIAEENPFLLAQMFLDPQAALQRLAPEFKQVEAEMEDHFWRSRYAKP